MKKLSSGTFGEIFIVIIMILLCLVTLYPFLYCLAYSLSDSIQASVNTITVFPIGFTTGNYAVVFRNAQVLNSFLISVARTVIGIVYTLLVTGLAAYAISKRKLPGNRIISLLLIIPMYLSGGLIPYYVLICDLKLFNNFLVFILPTGFWAFNMLIMRTYFDTIPESIEESVKLDGAGEFTIFTRIIIPLSAPIIATIAMFVGVAQWNSWFDGMLFITNDRLLPLQTLLQRLLLANFSADLKAEAFLNLNKNYSAESLKMATVMVTVIPIVCIYPFFQRYFIKGIMIGAVKA